MIKTDEDALICDLAEIYHIFDYKQLPPTKIAVFACGLGSESRIKMKLSGQKVPLVTMLIAGISDRLALLVWSRTKDGAKNRNRPTSLVSLLTETQVKENDNVAFESGEDFEKSRAKMLAKLGGASNGN